MRQLAERLDALIKDGGAAALRDGILALQQHDDELARRAGLLWGAAIGAMAAMPNSRAEESSTWLTQIVDLSNAGLHAWLGFVQQATAHAGAQSRPGDAYGELFRHVADMCSAGRRAMSGDTEARRAVDRSAAAAQRTVKAIRADERGH